MKPIVRRRQRGGTVRFSSLAEANASPNLLRASTAVTHVPPMAVMYSIEEGQPVLRLDDMRTSTTTTTTAPATTRTHSASSATNERRGAHGGALDEDEDASLADRWGEDGNRPMGSSCSLSKLDVSVSTTSLGSGAGSGGGLLLTRRRHRTTSLRSVSSLTPQHTNHNVSHSNLDVTVTPGSDHIHHKTSSSAAEDAEGRLHLDPTGTPDTANANLDPREADAPRDAAALANGPPTCQAVSDRMNGSTVAALTVGGSVQGWRKTMEDRLCWFSLQEPPTATTASGNAERMNHNITTKASGSAAVRRTIPAAPPTSSAHVAPTVGETCTWAVLLLDGHRGSDAVDFVKNHLRASVTQAFMALEEEFPFLFSLHSTPRLSEDATGSGLVEEDVPESLYHALVKAFLATDAALLSQQVAGESMVTKAVADIKGAVEAAMRSWMMQVAEGKAAPVSSYRPGGSSTATTPRSGDVSSIPWATTASADATRRTKPFRGNSASEVRRTLEQSPSGVPKRSSESPLGGTVPSAITTATATSSDAAPAPANRAEQAFGIHHSEGPRSQSPTQTQSRNTSEPSTSDNVTEDDGSGVYRAASPRGEQSPARLATDTEQKFPPLPFHTLPNRNPSSSSYNTNNNNEIVSTTATPRRRESLPLRAGGSSPSHYSSPEATPRCLDARVAAANATTTTTTVVGVRGGGGVSATSHGAPSPRQPHAAVGATAASANAPLFVGCTPRSMASSLTHPSPRDGPARTSLASVSTSTASGVAPLQRRLSTSRNASSALEGLAGHRVGLPPVADQGTAGGVTPLQTPREADATAPYRTPALPHNPTYGRSVSSSSSSESEGACHVARPATMVYVAPKGATDSLLFTQVESDGDDGEGAGDEVRTGSAERPQEDTQQACTAPETAASPTPTDALQQPTAETDSPSLPLAIRVSLSARQIPSVTSSRVAASTHFSDVRIGSYFSMFPSSSHAGPPSPGGSSSVTSSQSVLQVRQRASEVCLRDSAISLGVDADRSDRTMHMSTLTEAERESPRERFAVTRTTGSAGSPSSRFPFYSVRPSFFSEPGASHDLSSHDKLCGASHMPSLEPPGGHPPASSHSTQDISSSASHPTSKSSWTTDGADEEEVAYKAASDHVLCYVDPAPYLSDTSGTTALLMLVHTSAPRERTTITVANLGDAEAFLVERRACELPADAPTSDPTTEEAAEDDPAERERIASFYGYPPVHRMTAPVRLPPGFSFTKLSNDHRPIVNEREAARLTARFGPSAFLPLRQATEGGQVADGSTGLAAAVGPEGELTEEEAARCAVKRVGGRVAVSRALGDFDVKLSRLPAQSLRRRFRRVVSLSDITLADLLDACVRYRSRAMGDMGIPCSHRHNAFRTPRMTGPHGADVFPPFSVVPSERSGAASRTRAAKVRAEERSETPPTFTSSTTTTTTTSTSSPDTAEEPVESALLLSNVPEIRRFSFSSPALHTVCGAWAVAKEASAGRRKSSRGEMHMAVPYRLLVGGCDGVWELQSIAHVAQRVEKHVQPILQSMFTTIAQQQQQQQTEQDFDDETGASPIRAATTMAEWQDQLRQGLERAIAETLHAGINAYQPPPSGGVGGDNMTLSVSLFL